MSLSAPQKTGLRILVIGPSSAGKSTIINALINNSVTADSLTKPCVTSCNTLGTTAQFTNYYFGDHIFTDSIGIDDARFDMQEIMSRLRKLIISCIIGYNLIIFVTKDGTQNILQRTNVKMLFEIFGDNVREKLMVVVNHSKFEYNDKNKYLEEVKEDKEWVNIVGKAKFIIRTRFQQDTDEDLETVLIKKRKVSLKLLQDCICTFDAEKFIQVEARNAKETLKIISIMIYQTLLTYCGVGFFKRYGALACDKVGELFDENYGQCPICVEYLLKNNTLETICGHLFHKECLDQHLKYDQLHRCPICRKDLSSEEIDDEKK